MANLQRILGTLISTGLGGRSRRGPSFGRAAAGGGLLGGLTGRGVSRGAGLASLGMLAYRAYQEYQAGQQQGRGISQESAAASAADGGISGGNADMDDRKAQLLIRAMIAAANADGDIDADERQRILGKLEEAGADKGDRNFVDNEMRSPVALDTLLREVRTEEDAEQFYLASELAIDADTPAEKSYLKYLADRLQLDPKRVEELDRMSA